MQAHLAMRASEQSQLLGNRQWGQVPVEQMKEGCRTEPLLSKHADPKGRREREALWPACPCSAQFLCQVVSGDVPPLPGAGWGRLGVTLGEVSGAETLRGLGGLERSIALSAYRLFRGRKAILLLSQ